MLSQLPEGPVVVELKQLLDQALCCSDFCSLVLTNVTSLQRLEAGLFETNSHYLLLITYYLLLTTYYPLLTTHYLLLATHYLLITTYHLLEAGLLETNSQPVLLEEVFATVSATIRPQMQAGVPLHTRIHDNARGSFEIDAKMLTQMLTNLAQNAAKYTSAGLVQVEARAVQAISDGVTEMELIVRDSGPGMPAESMQSCFQKYNTRGGTGLGLYLTKLQAEQLCGQIELKSRAPPDIPGTEFRVTLPLRRSA
jgi:signal transduction histidine kinase